MTVMQAAAQKAAKRLLRDFNEVENLQVSVKGPGDFVSQADLRAEASIREDLEKARPGYAMLPAVLTGHLFTPLVVAAALARAWWQCARRSAVPPPP